jgi:hypothetical protein
MRRVGFRAEFEDEPMMFPTLGCVTPASERTARCERNAHYWVSDEARRCECGSLTRKFCRSCKRAL